MYAHPQNFNNVRVVNQQLVIHFFIQILKDSEVLSKDTEEEAEEVGIRADYFLVRGIIIKLIVGVRVVYS